MHMTIHILHHNNRIIDHQPDGQHQREQGQQIDGVTQGLHDKEGTHQRERNRHQWHHHRTPAPQKEEDHHGDNHQRLKQCLDHLLNRAVDEFCTVIDNLSIQTGWHLRLDLREYLLDTLNHLQHVGIRGDKDADKDRAFPIKGGGEVVVFCPQHHGSDILQPHNSPIRLTQCQPLELIH